MSATKGPITRFPAEGLRPARRFISGHNKEGKGVFVGDDEGEHHRIMVDGEAVANIIYSTAGNPVDMNDDKDLKFAKENEVRLLFPMAIEVRGSQKILVDHCGVLLHAACDSCRQRQRCPLDRFCSGHGIPNPPRYVDRLRRSDRGEILVLS